MAWFRHLWLLACLSLLFAAEALAATPATAAAAEPMLVTFAARTCPNFTDITANLARNDIQESLRDLGPDTPYRRGQAVDPAIELEHEPPCSPLPGWSFTFGTGHLTRAVSGPWGSLSIVTGAFPTQITTAASTPWLDPEGRPTGRTIAGATTVELTPAQAERAAQGSLWVQGGTPTEPILDPDKYAFGALRCAIDNLNGDNVEWIGYPTGTRHVFCFAYYVVPPPTSGTIIIRKQIDAPPGTSESFIFEGNLSFNIDGRFTLGVPSGQTSAQQTFYRAETRSGDPPWEVHERVPPDWHLASVSCNSASGASHASTDTAAASASITLAPADVVTCIFTNQFVPPGSGLLLRKVTFGATGQFHFAVTPRARAPGKETTAKTLEEGLAADAASGPLKVPPGTYSINQTPPASSLGRWSLIAAECDGHQLDLANKEATVSAGRATVCTLTSRLVPRGSIVIDKVSKGALATTGFVISPDFGPAAEIRQYATTVREGVPASASGEPSHNLELGRYLIQETSPAPAAGGAWTLTSVRCNGRFVPFAQGQATVTLSAATPAAACVFTNSFSTALVPPPGGADEPASLSISKRALAAHVPLGASVAYTVVVVNHGPGSAAGVVVNEQPSTRATLVSAHPSQGRCSHAPALTCLLGTLAPGARATIAITMTPHRAGTFVNTAVLGTSSQNPGYADAVASSRVRVRGHRPLPSFTG